MGYRLAGQPFAAFASQLVIAGSGADAPAAPITVTTGTTEPNGSATGVLGSLHVTPRGLSQNTDGGTTWAALGGGNSIWDRPATAHASDDEFISSTLGAAWSVFSGAFSAAVAPDPYATYPTGSTRYSLTRRASWLMMQPPADSVVQRIGRAHTFPANQFIWMRGSFPLRLNAAPNTNDYQLGLILSAAAFDGNNHLGLYLSETDPGVVQAEFHSVVGGVDTVVSSTADMWVSQGVLEPIEAVGYQKIGTTYHGWAFMNGGGSLYLGSVVYAPAVGSVAIQVTNSTSLAPGAAILGVDFVRFVDSAVWLP